MPRPTKLNAKRAQQICDYVAQGTPRRSRRSSLRDRLDHAVSLDEARRASAGQTLRRVLQGIKRADLEAELACLRQIKEAAQNGDWRQPGCSSDAIPRSGAGGVLGAAREELTVRSKAYERLVASG